MLAALVEWSFISMIEDIVCDVGLYKSVIISVGNIDRDVDMDRVAWMNAIIDLQAQ